MSRSFVVAPLLVALLAAAGSSYGVFPGRNGRIAFVRAVLDSDNQPVSRDVYSVDPNGTGLRNLTPGSRDQFWPAWSADGKRIVYVEADGASGLDISGYELWTMNADGSRKRRLTSNAAADQQPAWSPDGKWIVFSRRTGHGNFDLAVIRANGGRVRLLTRTNDLDELLPTWAPDGRRIAYLLAPRVDALTSRAGYYVLTVRTGRVQRVALDLGLDARPTWTPRGRLSITRAAWSPDGRLRLVANPQGPDAIARRIEIENPDGSLSRVVTKSVYPLDDYDPTWQPLPRRKAGGASVP